MSEGELEFHSFGKYEVLEEIGQGAMGVVYRAHDPVLDREVAIKTISASLGKDDELRKRFHREAQAAARLNHANIITIYEYGEAHGKIYIAMELLEGTDLKELMIQGALQTFDDQLAVMEQVLDGLAFAHSKQVVHRDLKPGNIHIQPNGQIKILDFGLARLGSSEMTQTGVVMGTPNYMSPEQVLGDRIDSRSDIFSIGAVFYELLSGQKPFDSESMHGVLFQVVHKDPPALKSWIGELPPVLVQVVERCLAKEKEQRFQDAGELRDAVATIRQALASGRGSEIALDAETGRVYYEGEEIDDAAGRSPRSWPPAPSLPPQPPPLADRSGSGPPAGSGAGSWVEGTVALDVGSDRPRPARPTSRPPVRRGADTLSGRSRTRPVPRPTPARSSGALLSIGIVALLALGGLGAWYAGLLPTPGGGTSDAASSTRLEAVTRALVRTQVDLARSHLDGKKYNEARTSAREALNLDPRNAAAREVLQTAEARLGEIETAAGDAQSLASAGDVEGASVALSRLLELDPAHPVGAQLSGQLNESFRTRAEEAQQAMQAAQAGAERAGARGAPEYASARRLADAARASLDASAFAAATRGFLEARDEFDRARQSAEAPAAEPAPTAVARTTPAPKRPATPVPQPSAVATPDSATPPPAPVVRAALIPRSTQNESGKKGPSGFEGAANPDFMGEIDFETPAEIGAGDEYTFRVFLKNVGRKRMRLRSLVVQARTNGETAAVAAPLLTDSVDEGERAAIAELSGTWPPGVESWSMQVIVTGDQGDTTSSRLVLRQ